MPCKNLDKALFFWETRYFVWKFENFDELQLSYSSIFFVETSHTFSTYHCLKKGHVGFFLFYLDLELFAKIKRDLVSSHSFFTLLLITQNLNIIKKSHTPFCRHYLVENVCKVSGKNIKIYGSWSSSKFSILQTKNLVFMEMIEVCLNLRIRFCITWLVLLSFKKLVCKNQF